MKYLALIIICFSSLSYADNFEDSNKLFDFAEENYPSFFSPVQGATFQVGEYLARYYEGTNTYIGTKGEEVYVLGDVFGGLVFVGRISDFIEITDCSTNSKTCD